MISVFFVSLVVLLYTYIVYPWTIILLGKIIRRKTTRELIEPTVSLIITAHNEEDCIRETIENSLILNYPKNKLQIIVASDCSTDGTNSIVKEYENKGIILCEQSERLGKTAAQFAAVRISKGDVLVFSDASTIYGRDAIHELVESLSGSSVGCVGGRIIFSSQEDSRSIKKNKLADIEQKVRDAESRIYSTIAVSGCIYAVKKSLYREIDSRIADDFGIPLNIAMRGYRVVFEPEAIAYEEIERHDIDINRNVRTINQGWVALSLLGLSEFFHNNKIRFSYLFSVLFSHKILRWLSFVPLFSIFLSSAVLTVRTRKVFYVVALAAQLFFYLNAIIGSISRRCSVIYRLPYRFCLYHYAAMIALYKFCRGKKIVTWD